MTAPGGQEQDALQPLREHGAPADVLARLAASGLPGEAACAAVAAASPLGRLRRMLAPHAALSAAEHARLTSIAALADDVLEMEGRLEAARRFWTTAMPWFGDKTPAEALTRRDGPGEVADLVSRVKYGIAP